MLRNCVVVDEYIALLPFVQNTNIIRESSKVSQVLFGYWRAVAVQLLGDVAASSVDFRILVVGRQSSEKCR